MTTSDRKSTRLNSSHVRISYAVFCLKKKNRQISLVSVVLVIAHPTILFIIRPELLALLPSFPAPWRARFAALSTYSLVTIVVMALWRTRLKLMSPTAGLRCRSASWATSPARSRKFPSCGGSTSTAPTAFFFLMIRRPPRSTLFPTRRSSDLGPDGTTADAGIPALPAPYRAPGQAGAQEAERNHAARAHGQHP